MRSEFNDIAFSALGESMPSSDVHPRFFTQSLRWPRYEMYSLLLRHRSGSSAPELRLLDARQRTPSASVLPAVRLFGREPTCYRYVRMRDLGMKGRRRRHH